MDDLPSPPDQRLIATTSVVFVLASLTLFVRVCVPRTNSDDILRRLSEESTKTRWRLEGFGLGICYVLLVCFTACVFGSTIEGLGYARRTLGEYEAQKVLRWSFVANVLYVALIFAAKMLLVMIYARIWYSVQFFWVLFGTLGLAWVSFIVTTIFSCIPMSAAWTLSGQCLNRDMLAYATTGTDLGLNLILMGLPILYLWSLDFNRRKGFGLLLMYIIGLTITATSICQLYYLATRVSSSTNLTLDTADYTVWRVIHANLSLALCCLPGMSRLIQGRPAHQTIFTEKMDFAPALYNTTSYEDSTVPPSYRTSKATRSSKHSSWRSSVRLSKSSSNRISNPFFYEGLLPTIPAEVHTPTLNGLKIPSPNISPMYDINGKLKAYKRQTIISWSPFARTASSNLIDVEEGREELLPRPESVAVPTSCRRCQTRLHPSACICMISRPHTVHESQRVGDKKLWRIDEEVKRRSRVYNSWPQ